MLEAESTPGPQCDRKDFMSMKNPLTPARIKPATFQFVAQHLNHCATAVPRPKHVENRNKHTRKILRQADYLQGSYQHAWSAKQQQQKRTL